MGNMAWSEVMRVGSGFSLVRGEARHEAGVGGLQAAQAEATFVSGQYVGAEFRGVVRIEAFSRSKQEIAGKVSASYRGRGGGLQGTARRRKSGHQSASDAIVGKMTIRSSDTAVSNWEADREIDAEPDGATAEVDLATVVRARIAGRIG